MRLNGANTVLGSTVTATTTQPGNSFVESEIYDRLTFNVKGPRSYQHTCQATPLRIYGRQYAAGYYYGAWFNNYRHGHNYTARVYDCQHCRHNCCNDGASHKHLCDYSIWRNCDPDDRIYDLVLVLFRFAIEYVLAEHDVLQHELIIQYHIHLEHEFIVQHDIFTISLELQHSFDHIHIKHLNHFRSSFVYGIWADVQLH
ncbi:hypothetical protein LTR78_005221 [Recurvomyces mirabilis]|uniref:Uncharacterized protein n=1 Tax=Recurvomyces mirabilis TaxID=574656 RepID=A0AAE1C1L3_9PEZI|nr:hypothetical protein LTR78_005221 [Recurvomyces mirabilis]KAK5157771.1 hypothetical protein LTS14_003693 [Recurvomyces mirabilis]